MIGKKDLLLLCLSYLVYSLTSRIYASSATYTKLTERAVFEQTHARMTNHSLYPLLQSAYRFGHSTETALLKVHNDLLMNMDAQRVPLLVLQCRSKGNISGGARKCWRGEPLGGSGGMLPQKNLKSRCLQMLFPAFSKSYL